LSNFGILSGHKDKPDLMYVLYLTLRALKK